MSRKQEVRAMTRPDPFLVVAGKAQNMLKEHQKTLAISGGVALVVAIAVGVSMSQRDNKSAQASQMLADAQEVFDKNPADSKGEAKHTQATGEKEDKETFKDDGEWQTAASAKFAEVIERYPSTGAGKISSLYLARLSLDKGDLPAAEKSFKAYLDEAGAQADLSGLALLGLGAALEDQHKLDEALTTYNKMIPALGTKKTGPFVADALLAVGRIKEKQNLPNEASDAYRRITEEFMQSTARPKAQSRLVALGKSGLPAMPSFDPAGKPMHLAE